MSEKTYGATSHNCLCNGKGRVNSSNHRGGEPAEPLQDDRARATECLGDHRGRRGVAVPVQMFDQRRQLDDEDDDESGADQHRRPREKSERLSCSKRKRRRDRDPKHAAEGYSEQKSARLERARNPL